MAQDDGATAVEYAVMLALIAGALITTIQTMGGSTQAFWQSNVNQVEQALENEGF